VSAADDVEAVLSQVVPLGPEPTAREIDLATSVARHVNGRAGRAIAPPDPDVLAQLRPQANLGLATTGELLDELRARIEVGGLLDYKTIGAE
jgi:hypothetical protein